MSMCWSLFLTTLARLFPSPMGYLREHTACHPCSLDYVKGIGSYVDGIEHPRVEVVLAAGIPEEACQQINLGYMDPDELDIRAYEDRENEGFLVVPNAGEMLYRLSDGSVPR